jgi:hypothetical protein
MPGHRLVRQTTALRNTAMNPALQGCWERMLALGLDALAHSNRLAYVIPFENPHLPELSILQAAHATELIIKARIAMEHPLLIFDRLPARTQPTARHLDLNDLFERGRTLQWAELPDRLWAATGIEVADQKEFFDFGRLRNGIQHFSPPPSGTDGEVALRFVFKFLDPLLHASWGLYAIDRCQDDDIYINFTGTLARLEIRFLVSPHAAAEFGDWDVNWGEVNAVYADEMRNRVLTARGDR